jgi:hypothetical protein
MFIKTANKNIQSGDRGGNLSVPVFMEEKEI